MLDLRPAIAHVADHLPDCLSGRPAPPLVAGVATVSVSPRVLCWVPLMRGGGAADIIMPCRAAAGRLIADERDRSVLPVLPVTFD